jgi:ATP-dependent helicase/nuclease subunit A
VIASPQLAEQDASARNRIRQSLDESLIVEASAGTGKTTELVNRIVQVLAQGRTEIDKIVAVTFTNKAAGELKIRVREKLDDERLHADAETKERLEKAVEELEEASIGTIHGFCAQILRSRPVEACIDPAFEELTEPEAQRIYDRAFDSWFQQQLDRDSPGLHRALARLAWREDRESGPALEQIKASGRKLIEWRDFKGLWQPDAFDRDGRIHALLAEARQLRANAATCINSSDALLGSLRPLRDLLAWIERGGVSDPDTLEAVLLKLGRDLKRNFRKGSGRFSHEFTREAILRASEALQASLEQFRIDSGVLLACQLQSEMQSLIQEYTDLKTRSGKLDFVDLLLLAFNLLSENEIVRRYFQQRFTHIFVDEFQDTDPLQAAILLLLSANEPGETDWQRVTPSAGKLFLVGDPKQSIYKFRRADVSLYERVCTQLESRGVGRVYLTSSFRSLRSIKQFVNTAFTPEMTGDIEAAQAAYSPLHEDGEDLAGQPAVIALPAPTPLGNYGRVTKIAINACLPATVAAFVYWLIHESGWHVREGGEHVPVRDRHVCILFRRFISFQTDLTRDYVRALEARNVRHLLVGSKSFHDREEVQAIRTALGVIEWPEDELSVYAVLRGSLFAISDNVLLRFRHEQKRLHPFRKYPAELAGEFRQVTEALAVLAELHRWRNRRPFSDTIRLLLDKTRAYAGFALRPGGQQVLANVLRICDLAREFELTGGFSFRGFVDELNAQAEKTEAPEAPVLEEGAEGVRLMTVHAAKGLEFPIVILADMTANLAAQDPDRFIDAKRNLCATRLLRCAPRELLDDETQERTRERAEGVRVCYVAATRARDFLVVPAVGEGEQEGWLGPLNKALYPPRKAFRAARQSDWFSGNATVLGRMHTVRDDQEPSIKPGWHKPEFGGYQVLWWDPASLDLDVPDNFGLQNINLLKAEGASIQSLKDYELWRDTRRQTTATAAAPSVEIVRVTEMTDEPPFALVRTERVTGDSLRSGGRRFGTLLHTVIRDAEWDADEKRLARLAAMHARIGGASRQEECDAIAAVERLLAHPVLRRAAVSARCFRELPVSFPITGKRVLEGVIDLIFMEDGHGHIVDFKTDEDLLASREAYERQLRWYMHAFRTMTGLSTEGTLLQI